MLVRPSVIVPDAGGGGVGVGAVTVIGVLWLAEPPAPVQLIEYVVVCVGETLTEPKVPLALKPEPVHEVALVELHESTED